MSKDLSQRGPLRNEPLRLPGESLERQIEGMVGEFVLPWFASALLLCILAGIEWYRWAFNPKPQPFLVTFGALVFAGFAAWKVRKAMKVIRRLRLGARGEKLTAQFLNEFASDGYVVFHDIPEDAFNVDHVLIGPTGIFAIETKYWNYGPDGACRIDYDERQVWKNGLLPDRNPIEQAEAIADHVQKVIQNQAGRNLEVRPVGMIPGWQVRRRGRGGRTWVLGFQGLTRFLEHESKKLDENDVKMTAGAIRRHIQSRVKEG